MSAAGPAAALALKRQSGLMAQDMGLDQTTHAGQEQRSAAAAAGPTGSSGPAGAYNVGAMVVASHSLPAQPPSRNSVGRPQGVAPLFQQAMMGPRRGRGQGRGAGRRGRGRTASGNGDFKCPRCFCGLKAKDTLLKSHYKEYAIVHASGETELKRLCIDVDARQIKELKEATAAAKASSSARASDQSSLRFAPVVSATVMSPPAQAGGPSQSQQSQSTVGSNALDSTALGSTAPLGSTAAPSGFAIPADSTVPSSSSATPDDPGFDETDACTLVASSSPQEVFWNNTVLP